MSSPRNRQWNFTIAKPIAVVILIATIALPSLFYLQVTVLATTPSYGKHVLAFYYGWYGNTTVYDGEPADSASSWVHWNQNDHNPPNDLAANQTPVLGAFDSYDNDTIAQHIAWAQSAGIDTFICSWWGPGSREDDLFAKTLRYAADNNINFSWTVYFESVQSQYEGNGTAIYQDIKYLCDQYGSNSRFLKVDGRPVIFCYAVAADGLDSWTQARQLLTAAGYNPFLVGDIGSIGAPSPTYLSIFDGIHVYNPDGLIYAGGDYNSLYQQMIFSTHQAGELACYTVSPGYDDFDVCECSSSTGRNTWFAVPREDGTLYQQMWASATSSQADWILICTFNEWHEGTEIEPSVQFGNLYLDIAAQYAIPWKA
jgi:hypothetical protein